MKAKYTLAVALFFALIVGLATPINAQARWRVHVYVGAQPSYYYYQPAPGFYYTQPASTYYYYQPVPRYYYYRTVTPRYYYRSHYGHWDRGRHRGWYRHRDREGDWDRD